MSTGASKAANLADQRLDALNTSDSPTILLHPLMPRSPSRARSEEEEFFFIGLHNNVA